MNVFQILLIWLVAFLLFIVSMYAFPLVEKGVGNQHRDFSTMLESGPVWTDTNENLGFIFGGFVMGILSLALVIGVQRKGNMGRAATWYWVGIVVYITTYIILVTMQWNYEPGNIDSYIIGFPPATAWMLIVVWFMPAYFTFLYIWKFDEWILSPEDLERFHALVAENRKKHGSA